MDYDTYSFRMADEILKDMDAYQDIQATLGRLTTDLIVERHLSIVAKRTAEGKKTPAGAQTAINELLRTEAHGFDPRNWEGQVYLFHERGAKVRKNVPIEKEPLRAWTMDFKRDRVGVEVSFNPNPPKR